jgi:lysophospholipase L1-like esterase
MQGRNGLAYLPISLQSHWPLDMVILGLGTNDCKATFNASPRVIAKGLETVVQAIQGYGAGTGFPPAKVLVVSPIHIGSDIEHGQFASYDRTSYEKSLALAPLFRQVADAYGCLFLDASDVAAPSEIDQLHLDADGHECVAKALVPIVQAAFRDPRDLRLDDPDGEPEKDPEDLPARPEVQKQKKGPLFRIPGFSRKRED